MNYRTTIGGALGALGSALTGVGVLGQFNAGDHSKELWYIALAGYIISASAKFTTALFAADAKSVADLNDKVDSNARQTDPVKV